MNVKQLLIWFYTRILFVVRFCWQKYKTFRNFYMPNLKRINTSKITIGQRLKVNQKVRLSGQGTIQIGDNVTLGFIPGGFINGAGIELQARTRESVITIGKNVSTNNNIFICSAGEIMIKDNVLLGQNITIMDFEAHGIHPDKRGQVGQISSVCIEENVWVGNNVTILKGSKIGRNSIVAAHAIVSGEFPDNVIVGGVPAKIIKKIN